MMTVQYIYERAQRLFPEVGETEVVNATNRVVKEYCIRTEILSASKTLTKVASTVTYDLSASSFDSAFGILKKVDFIDSAGNYALPGYAPLYKTEGVNITFYAADGSALSDMPSEYSVVIGYSKYPSALTIASSLPTPDEFNDYIESGVFRELYSIVPVKKMDKEGNMYTTVDWNGVTFHSQKFETGIREGLRYKNMNRNNSAKNIIQYDY